MSNRITALSNKVVITEQPGDLVGVDFDETKLHHQRLAGSGKNTHAAIDSHLSSSLNPHSVRAEQTGAVPVTTKDQPNGVPGLDAHGLISEATIPKSIARYVDMQRHANSNANPHSVSARQIGAVEIISVGTPDGVAPLDGKARIPKKYLPKDLLYNGDVSLHYNDQSNPHGVTAIQVGAVPQFEKGRPNGVVPLGQSGRIDDGFLPDSVVYKQVFYAHEKSESNPHKVTSLQIGAVPVLSVGSAEGVAPLDKECKLPIRYLPDGVTSTSDFYKHLSDGNNPHKITAAGIGAIPVSSVGTPGGVAGLDAEGKLLDNTIPPYVVKSEDLEFHLLDTSNPHNLTPDSVGCVGLEKVASPNGVAPLDSMGVIPCKYLPDTVVRSKDARAHYEDTSNPHKVTASDIGAIHISDIGSPGGVPRLDIEGRIDKSYMPYDSVYTASLKSHLLDVGNPHNTTPEQVGCSEPVWNALKLRGLKLPDKSPNDGDILRWSGEESSFVYDTESMIGEVNIGENLSSGNMNVYSHKDGDVFYFRGIRARSNRMQVRMSDDGADLEFDVSPVNIEHDMLLGTGNYSHATIDAHINDTCNPHRVTAAQVGNEVAQWNANKILGRNLSVAEPADGQVLRWDSRVRQWVPSNEAASDAESNTAINVGTKGVGIFKRKENAVLEFKKIASLSNKLSIGDDERNSRITFDIKENTIVHDRLSGAGKCTHDDLDVHVSSSGNPHNVTASQVGCSKPEWNANSIHGVYVDTSLLKDGDVLVYSKEDNKFVCASILELVREAIKNV